jgi:hypothetical protein
MGQIDRKERSCMRASISLAPGYLAIPRRAKVTAVSDANDDAAKKRMN